MPTTSPRLGLDITQSTDAVSGFPAADAQAKAILDNAVIYEEGTLAARSNPSYDGQVYKTTDSGAESLSWFDGASWLPLGLIPASKSASASVVSGQAILTTGASAITITLPAHANGQIVAVKNGSTGGTTVSGSSIQGLGLSSASSFPLGAVGSAAVLIDDGTSWHFLAGQQDTGWVAITSFATGFAQDTFLSRYPLSARVRGDSGELRGAIINNSGAGLVSSDRFMTLPSVVIPAHDVTVSVVFQGNSGAAREMFISAGEQFSGTAGQCWLPQSAFTTNQETGFDGVCYAAS